MILIRETFVAKPGKASQLAAMFKQALSGSLGLKVRVLTDFVGPFNTVVMETEATDLAEFSQRMREYMEKDEIRQHLKGYTELYQEGRREIYQVM